MKTRDGGNISWLEGKNKLTKSTSSKNCNKLNN